MHGPGPLHMQVNKKVPSLLPVISSTLKINPRLPSPVTAYAHLHTWVLPAAIDPAVSSINDWHVCSQEPGMPATESSSDKITGKALAGAQELSWGLEQKRGPLNQINHSASPLRTPQWHKRAFS